MRLVQVRKNWPPYAEGFRYAIRFDSCWSRQSVEMEQTLTQRDPGRLDWTDHVGRRRLVTRVIGPQRDGGNLVMREHVTPYYICFRTKAMSTHALLLK